ncbi:hypothetical protein G6L37_05710 [Agrobacterium rubi]|nr:hypothetical protein [Agrobacterium rubi]NTF24855.1 hypothetical protein [Agrobacterium rubi]
MIKILGPGEEPAEHASDLVGRYVGKEGGRLFLSYGRPLLVTGYSGSRLYVRTGLFDHAAGKGENTRMKPSEEWDEEAHIQMKSVAYVCDTIEECEIMMSGNSRSMTIWDEGQRRIQAEGKAVFEGILSEQANRPAP